MNVKEEMASKKPHAIMVCAHLQGHINPFVNLSTKLASKGFSITFALLESTHRQISKSQHNNSADIFAAARSSGLDIRCTTFSDGFPLDFDRTTLDYLNFYRSKFVDSVDEVVGKILTQSDSGCNNFLIADTMCVWWKKVAEKYGLASVCLWTQGALVFSLLYHWELMREKGHVPVNGRRQIVDYLPGIDPINTKDFMSQLLDDGIHPHKELSFEALVAVKSADFVVCNTVQELEAEPVSALQQQQPFYAVGPLFSGTTSVVPKSLLPETETADWLNSRPPRSVLYISFGSLVTGDRNVITAIAGGLLASEGVSFVWVVRPGMLDSGDVVPDQEFRDKTGKRGVVVAWCRQREVLQNPAIGGFLTHCGWNSVLESVECGVPMICYPFRGDQITNRKLVVDDWRVGINLCDDGDSISKEVVAEKIEILMNEKRSQHLRQQIHKIKGTFRDAVSAGGSSQKNFDSFVEDVSAELLRRSCH